MADGEQGDITGWYKYPLMVGSSDGRVSLGKTEKKNAAFCYENSGISTLREFGTPL